MLACALALGLGSAGSLRGQDTGDGDRRDVWGPKDDQAALSAGGLEIKPIVGLLSSVTFLADEGDTLQAELSTAAAYGAEITYWTASGLGFSAVATYSSPDMTAERVSVEGFPVTTDFGGADVWFVTGNLMYRPHLERASSIMRPYVGIGVGIRSLSAPGGSGAPFEDQTDVAGSLVAGTDVVLNRRLLFSLGIRDYISSFSDPALTGSKLQHDFVLSAGLAIRTH